MPAATSKSLAPGAIVIGGGASRSSVNSAPGAPASTGRAASATQAARCARRGPRSRPAAGGAAVDGQHRAPRGANWASGPRSAAVSDAAVLAELAPDRERDLRQADRARAGRGEEGGVQRGVADAAAGQVHCAGHLVEIERRRRAAPGVAAGAATAGCAPPRRAAESRSPSGSGGRMPDRGCRAGSWSGCTAPRAARCGRAGG